MQQAQHPPVLRFRDLQRLLVCQPTEPSLEVPDFGVTRLQKLLRAFHLVAQLLQRLASSSATRLRRCSASARASINSRSRACRSFDEQINNSVLCDACLPCQCIALLTQALLPRPMAGASRACSVGSRNPRGSCLSYLRPSGSACPPPLETGASPAEIATELGIRALWFELHLAVLANATQGGGSEACLLIVVGLNCPAMAHRGPYEHFYIYRLV